MAGGHVYVLGGANSAGQAALHLAHYARQVTLVVRAASLAAGMSHYLVRQVGATPNVEVRLETEIVGGGGDAGWLDHLVLRSRATGDEERVAADGLFLMIGADPNTGWLPPELGRDAEGFLLTGPDVPRDGWPLARSPFRFETSMPSVMAVGDARYGSVKRVASAVGEGSVAIQLVHRLLALDGLEPWSAEPGVPRSTRRRSRTAGGAAPARPAGAAARREQDHLLDALARGGAVRIVDLDQVARRVAQVELGLAAGQLGGGVAEGLAVEDAELARPLVDGDHVVDLQGEVRPVGRLVRPLEEVHLLAADLEPLHGEAEVGRRDALEPEHLLVEARRLLEVARDDAHVVEADGDLHEAACGEAALDEPGGVRRGQRLAGRLLEQPVPTHGLPGPEDLLGEEARPPRAARRGRRRAASIVARSWQAMRFP